PRGRCQTPLRWPHQSVKKVTAARRGELALRSTAPERPVSDTIVHLSRLSDECVPARAVRCRTRGPYAAYANGCWKTSSAFSAGAASSKDTPERLSSTATVNAFVRRLQRSETSMPSAER